jgi:hypothetical protein
MVVPKTGFINPFATTLDALKPLATSKKDTDVTFEIQGKSVHVRYGVEQCWLPCNDKVNTRPSPPKQMATNSKRLLDALASAARCTDPTNTKTALAGICLRGTQVLACTGVQLVALDGFTFPFKEEGVVCPTSKIFSAKELTTADTNEVIVGAVDGWVYFAVGTVELWLRAITDGKFPKVVGIMNLRRMKRYCLSTRPMLPSHLTEWTSCRAVRSTKARFGFQWIRRYRFADMSGRSSAVSSWNCPALPSRVSQSACR